jgi:hypothetical protein
VPPHRQPLERRAIEGEVRDQALQPAVFILELAQAAFRFRSLL